MYSYGYVCYMLYTTNYTCSPECMLSYVFVWASMYVCMYDVCMCILYTIVPQQCVQYVEWRVRVWNSV